MFPTASYPPSSSIPSSYSYPSSSDFSSSFACTNFVDIPDILDSVFKSQKSFLEGNYFIMDLVHRKKQEICRVYIKSGDVNAGIMVLQNFVGYHSQFMEYFYVPEKFIGGIIGMEGENIKKLACTYNVLIDISNKKKETNYRKITIYSQDVASRTSCGYEILNQFQNKFSECIEKELKQEKQEKEEKEKKVYQEMKNEIESLKLKLEEKNQKIILQEEMIHNLKSDIEKLSINEITNNEKLNFFEIDLKKKENEILQKNEKLKLLKNNLKKKNDEIQEKEDLITFKNIEIDFRNKKLNDQTNQINNLKEKYDQNLKIIELKKLKIEELRTNLISTNSSLQKKILEVQKLTSNLKKQGNNSKRITENLQKTIKELDNKDILVMEKEDKITYLENEIESKNSKISKMDFLDNTPRILVRIYSIFDKVIQTMSYFVSELL